MFILSFENRGPAALRLGLVTGAGIDAESLPPGFDNELDALLRRRATGLSQEEDAWRSRVRDILRNGTYKPTGRGKPASEYLLRSAAEARFPRISAPVDVCNFVSLLSLLPISIWDLDRSPSDSFRVRLGAPDESYVFNEAGQSIDLTDLVLGAAVTDSAPEGVPIVNPVKDGLTTKTTPATRRVAALVYAPDEDGPAGTLAEIARRFAALLAACGDASASFAVLDPGARVELSSEGDR